jgi:hypothetical protein
MLDAHMADTGLCGACLFHRSGVLQVCCWLCNQPFVGDTSFAGGGSASTAASSDAMRVAKLLPSFSG